MKKIDLSEEEFLIFNQIDGLRIEIIELLKRTRIMAEEIWEALRKKYDIKERSSEFYIDVDKKQIVFPFRNGEEKNG